MNKPVKDLFQTLNKINLIKIIDSQDSSDNALMVKFTQEDEIFFALLKPLSENYIVMNISNPVALVDLKNMDSHSKYTILNSFNMYTIGVKALIADEAKNHFIFTREEILSTDVLLDTDLVQNRLCLALDLTKESVDILGRISKEFTENGKK
ncbi:hypothetical protein ACEOXG_001866 [Enterobacter hormaechei]|uniref:hypothetical protein n=1 Tax=Enterobacter hormaechei TaxID=158836 RepID=UPI00125A30C2|nr:hypothetical protein [Enterobacter hormaechei]VAF16700.1 Uncharacterised protein [Enterobacter hormaechei]